MLASMQQAIDGYGLSRAEAAALLGWWLEAGADCVVGDGPRDWRKPAVKAPAANAHDDASVADVRIEASGPAPALAAAAAPAGERPATLEAFHAWLAQTADLPLFRAGAARALPHGPAEAEIMLLTGVPGAEDVAEGQPIGGSGWALATRMLAAIGVAPDAAYVTALTCFSSDGTRFTTADTEACRDTVLAQIAMAAPRRLLLLGDAPARLLLGLPLAQARGRVHRIGGVPCVATFHPRQLIERPADKALAWRDLLLMMGEPA